MSLKNLFFYFLSTNIKRPQYNSSDNFKILIITYDALGDMIMTVPLFNAIKEQKPSWKLHILTSPRNSDILKPHKNIEKIWSIDINKSFFKLDINSKQILKKFIKKILIF